MTQPKPLAKPPLPYAGDETRFPVSATLPNGNVVTGDQTKWPSRVVLPVAIEGAVK